MLWADMMKDAGDGAADARVETFGRIHVDRVANIFAAGMLHGLVLGETLTNGQAFHSSLIKWASQFDLRFHDAFACP